MKLFLQLLLILPFAAFSQAIQSDQFNDSGTIRRIATTRVEFNGATTSLGGTLKITPNETILCLNLFFKAGTHTSTTQESKAILQLDNEEVLYLHNTGNYKALSFGEAGAILFNVNDVDKRKLQTHKVVKYSIETNNGIVQVELSKAYQKAFMRTIALLEAQANSQNSLGRGF
jgi:hypothetical protein